MSVLELATMYRQLVSYTTPQLLHVLQSMKSLCAHTPPRVDCHCLSKSEKARMQMARKIILSRSVF